MSFQNPFSNFIKEENIFRFNQNDSNSENKNKKFEIENTNYRVVSLNENYNFKENFSPQFNNDINENYRNNYGFGTTQNQNNYINRFSYQGPFSNNIHEERVSNEYIVQNNQNEPIFRFNQNDNRRFDGNQGNFQSNRNFEIKSTNFNAVTQNENYNFKENFNPQFNNNINENYRNSYGVETTQNQNNYMIKVPYQDPFSNNINEKNVSNEYNANLFIL